MSPKYLVSLKATRAGSGQLGKYSDHCVLLEVLSAADREVEFAILLTGPVLREDDSTFLVGAEDIERIEGSETGT